jgi:hypothetical protein
MTIEAMLSQERTVGEAHSDLDQGMRRFGYKNRQLLRVARMYTFGDEFDDAQQCWC